MSRKVETEVVLGLVEEARGYLPAIRHGIEDFRGHPDQVDRLEEAHRHVHTIKGACSMVGLAGLSHLAYLLEEALEDLACGGLAMGEETARLLLTSVGWIEARLEGVLRGDPEDRELLAEATRAYRRLRGQPEEGDAEAVAQVWATLAPEAAPAAEAPPPEPPVAEADLPLPDFTDAPAEAPPASEAEVPAEEDGAAQEEPVPPELLEVFSLEADEHLRNISGALPGLEQGGDTRESVQAIRRSAHTLKGTAAMVGFCRVTQLAHRMEDLLDLLYEGRLSVTPEITRLLFASTDALEDLAAGRPTSGLAALYDAYAQLLAAVPPAAEGPDAAPEEGAGREEAPAVARQKAAPAGRGSFVRVPIERLDEMVKLVSELVIARSAFEQRLRDYARQVDELKRSTERLRQVSHKLESGYESSALAGGPRTRYYVDDGAARPASRAEAYGFDDLEFDNYTEFHLQSRALAETTADVQTVAGDLGQALGDFDGFLGREARLTGEIEDKLMRLRMVPLATLTPRLQRTVRTVADQLGKSAELVLEGEATELDKTVLEEMADPLLHLLRNAVDHGIEAPEERRRLGKPERGVVRLRGGHEGNQIVLRVADDGAGLDPERLRAAAVQKGLLSAAEAAGLRDEDLYSLVFLPGFSTAAEVSEVSGRGVGLDVVRAQVHKLKGILTVEGRPGAGATFTVRLPMTLAITRALLVKSHQETFAIPLDAVQQILRLEGAEVERLGQEPVLRVGGQVYPVVSLGRALNLKQPADASVTRPPVVILKVGDRQVALLVEHLLGGREIVIKNLGSHLRHTPGVTGATLTGDGRVVLILSPAELVGEGGWANARFPVRPAPAPPQAPAAREELTVMLVDDSPSVRRVLSGLVQRVGWNAVAAKDGLEALELLQGSAELPDLILLDVEMPRMDGYELLSTLRSQPAYRDLPVVMVTSRAGEKHRRKALDTGASAYVVKPYQDEDLLGVIRRLVRDARQAARGMSAAIRVVVVDDSPSVCRLLASHLLSAGGVEVVGTAHDGEQALALVRGLRPQVVTLDLQMPGAGGLAALEAIMRDCPTAVLVVSGVSRRAAEVTLQALELGAVDFILKYTPGSATDPEALRREVVAKVRLAARVKVIRSLGPITARPPGASRFVPLVKRPVRAKEPVPPPAEESAPSVLVVGASTGGPRALGELLRELPADFPAAVVVVQHLPAAFTPELAAHLRRQVRLPVKEAEVGDRLRPGRALVAPGGRHLIIGTEGQVGLIGARWVAGPSPSIDLTMQSAVRFAGRRAAGVVLTGMGADGRRASAIRARGGATFAQDGASCVIFGMPQQAIERGVVDHVAPPAEIGRRLRSLPAWKGE